MQVRAMASNKLHMPSEAAMDTAASQGRKLINDGTLGNLAWPALLRMLDRNIRTTVIDQPLKILPACQMKPYRLIGVELFPLHD